MYHQVRTVCSKQILSVWWLTSIECCVKLTGVQRREVWLSISRSRPGTNSDEDDRTWHERWNVGDATELSSCSVVDANTGKDLRGNFLFQNCIATDSFVKVIGNILMFIFSGTGNYLPGCLISCRYSLTLLSRCAQEMHLFKHMCV